MNEGLKFSAPNVNMHIQSVDYSVEGDTVVCTITPARFTERDCYTRIANAAVAARLMDFAPLASDLSLITQSPTLVAHVDQYWYTGTARLKRGDASDIEFAKQVAYKKAFRSFITYYFTNYNKIYERLATWLDCITCNARSEYSAAGQLEQLITRFGELDAEIREMTCR